MAQIKPLTVCDVLSNFYSISENGVVFNCVRGREIKPKTDKDGYLSVTLCTNELAKGKEHRRKTFRVGNLVLKQFIGEPPVTMKDPTQTIANAFGVEKSTIYAIKKKKIWKWVDIGSTGKD